MTIKHGVNNHKEIEKWRSVASCDRDLLLARRSSRQCCRNDDMMMKGLVSREIIRDHQGRDSRDGGP